MKYLSPMCVDAVFLNTHARGGRGNFLWGKFLQSPQAKQLKFKQAKIFDMAAVSESKNLFAILSDWTSNCIKQGCRHFVAVGGDGTVNIAVNVLYPFIEFKPILGAVGIGSSNDFHKPFFSNKRTQISTFPCRLNFQAAFEHDLGEVTYCLEEQNLSKVLFVINSSLGFVAEANHHFNQKTKLKNFLKRISVNSAIFFSAINVFFKFKSKNIQIKWDQHAFQKANLINLGIIKNIHFAGDFCYDIPRLPNDGLFGFNWFGSLQNTQKKNISKLQMLKTFFALLKGKFCGLPNTFSTQCQKISFCSSDPIALETDGEVRLVTHACYKVLPRKLLLCP